MSERICKNCQKLSECQREYGADPYDPACGGFYHFETQAERELRQVLAEALSSPTTPGAPL